MKRHRTGILLIALLFSGLGASAQETSFSAYIERGDDAVEDGIAAVERGNYRAGMRLLRSGLERSPANLKGRAALAEVLETVVSRPDLAGKVLVDGLEHGGVREYDYLRTTLRFLLNHERHEIIRSVVPPYLFEKGIGRRAKGAIGYTLAQSYFLTGHHQASLQYLRNSGADRSLEGGILLARIHWERGNQAEAFALLNAGLEKAGREDAKEIFRLLVGYRERQGKLEGAEQTAKLWRLRAPSDYLPRVHLYRLLLRQGETREAAREARELIGQFSGNEEAMVTLANQATDLGRVELVRELYLIAEAGGFETEVFALLLVEAHLAAGDYAAAIASANRILAEEPGWSAAYRAMLRGLRAVARCGKEGSGGMDEELEALVLNDAFGPASFAAIARRMAEANCFREAIAVIEAGLERFPESGGLDASLRSLSVER